MYSDFTIWQVDSEEKKLCELHDLGQAMKFVENTSKKFPKKRFDLRVTNDKGIENLGVFLGGVLVGLDATGK